MQDRKRTRREAEGTMVYTNCQGKDCNNLVPNNTKKYRGGIEMGVRRMCIQ